MSLSTSGEIEFLLSDVAEGILWSPPVFTSPFFAAVLARQAVTGNFDNVITDGFPTGLPAGTPLGVKIALASTQQREYPNIHEEKF